MGNSASNKAKRIIKILDIKIEEVEKEMEFTLSLDPDSNDILNDRLNIYLKRKAKFELDVIKPKKKKKTEKKDDTI